MAKRFGRNQRRKLLAEVVRLAENEARAWDYVRNSDIARAKLDQEVREWDERIRLLLGETSSFGRRMKVYGVKALGQIREHAILEDVCAIEAVRSTDAARFPVPPMDRIRNFCIAAHQDTHNLRHYISFIERDQQNGASYCISDTQFRAVGLDRRAVQLIAEDIIRHVNDSRAS